MRRPLAWPAAVFGLIVALAAAPARAENPPAVISPLSVVSDNNNVNITDGQIRIDMPGLSVPAAPRLNLDRVQNAMPYLVARITSGQGELVTSSVSVHYGGSASESFTCRNDDVCSSYKVNGSVLGGAIAMGGPYTFTASPSGAVYTYDRLSYDSGVTAPRQLIYYVSSIVYPDGETISYSYQTGNYSSGQGQTLFRVTQISSSVGYSISFSYQGSDPNFSAWKVVAQETLYKTSDPATPLARYTYSGSGMTDLAGRTFTCAGCDNTVGGQIEMPGAIVTLPGEATAAENVVPVQPIPNNYAVPYVVSSVQRDGVTWSYSYANFRATASPEGYGYDSLTVSGPAGFHQVYNIAVGANQRSNRISSVVDSLNRTTSYSYDVNSRPILITYPEGNSVSVTYDKWGNILTRTSQPKPGSGQTALTESAAINATDCSQNQVLCYRITSYTDPLGRVTDYIYDYAGRLVQQTDPADATGVRRVKYLSYGGSFTAPALVRLCGLGTTCGTNAEIKTQYSYLGLTALPLTATQIDDSTGTSLTTTYSYDNAGRLLSEDGPLAGTGDARYFRYDVVGRRTWEIGPANADGTRPATRTTYRDADDRVVAVESGTLPDSASSSLTVTMRADTSYDAHRNPSKVATSAGGTTYKVQSASFDDRGQQICATVRMNPAAFAAPPADACALGTQGSNGPDRVTRNTYDAAGQLTLVQKAYGTALQQNYVAYTYTPNGKQASVTDANGNLAAMSYDGFDRLKQWTFPSKTAPGQVNAADYEAYGYDAAGNRVTLRKRDGVFLAYQYDGLNRVTVKTVPASASGAAGYSVYYGYDARGLQLYARFGSASGPGVATAYDGFGRPTASTTTMGGISRSLSYLYDAAGARTRVTHPDGVYFTMGYDGASRMTSVSWTTGAGTTPFLSLLYDTLGRRTVTGRISNTTTYGYDAIGRLATDSQYFVGALGDATTTFGYNAASQIVSRALSSDEYAFTGAVNVNRTYAVNGLNQYITAGAASFTYDANGNLTGDGAISYAYDAENRLVTASNGTTLAYDPLGRLWQVTSSTYGTTQFLADGDETAVEYDGANGTIRRRFFWGPGVDEPILQDDGGAMNCSTTRFLHANYQGSIVAASNCSGARANVDAYDEWGIPNATNWGRYQYTGQAWLAELGMYYYKARFYSPTLARFMQTDPIGYEDQVNLYAYVGNDPVDGRDPTGLAECTTDSKGVKTCRETPTGSLISRVVSKTMAAGHAAVGWVKNNPGKTALGVVAVAATIACVIAEPCGIGEAVLGGGAAAGEAGEAAAGAEIAGAAGKNLLGRVTAELGARGFEAPQVGRILGWGKGLAGSSARLGSMDGAVAAAEARQAGMTRAMVQSLRDGYRDAVARGAGGPVSPVRVQILDKILSSW